MSRARSIDPTASLLGAALERLAAALEGGDATPAAGLVDQDELASFPGRLAELVARIGLAPPEVDLLVIAAAPQVDRGFGALFAAVDGSPPRAGPSVALAYQLSGLSLLDADDRLLVHATGALRRYGLLRMAGEGSPLPDRTLSVPDRVVRYLLGSDVPALDVAIARIPLVPVPSDVADVVARAVLGGVGVVHLRERPRASGRAVAAAAAETAGLRTVAIDLVRLRPEAVDRTLEAAVLEAVLDGGVLVAGPADGGVVDATRLEALADAPCPVILHGSEPLPSAGPVHSELRLEVDSLSSDDRLRVWRDVLQAVDVPVPAGLERIASIPVAPERALHAAYGARALALGQRRAVTAGDLADAARSQADGRLEALVEVVQPAVTFQDVVTTDLVREELRRIVDRIRHQQLVRDTWGLSRVSGRSQGVTGLFAGPSGTGKTLSAEALAGELRAELYVVDLSTIVDKYVGETEKNLERVFTAAEAQGGVLFFDEADALFGKRSEVRDAHDRFANIEVAYLLQRIERYDGIAVLASNLRSNLDDAFLRRLDVVISFDEPDEAARRALWDRHLPPELPRDDDVDLDFLAAAVPLTGGLIRNVCVDAAFCAAADGTAVTMGHLVRSTVRAQRMAGRLLDITAFGRWAAELPS